MTVLYVTCSFKTDMRHNPRHAAARDHLVEIRQGKSVLATPPQGAEEERARARERQRAREKARARERVCVCKREREGERETREKKRASSQEHQRDHLVEIRQGGSVLATPPQGAKPYRVISFIGTRAPLGPYRRPMPMVLGGS